MTTNQSYDKELKELETALTQISESVSELKINPIKLKNNEAVAAWMLEDADRNRMYIVVSASGEAEEGEQGETDLIFTVEAEVGQFVELEAKDAKVFLELNYSGLTLSKIAVTQDLRLVVLHRRWFEGITSDDVASAVAEVWNVSENLRASLNPVSPGHA